VRPCGRGRLPLDTAMQNGYSWVIDGQLAGMPVPGSGNNLEDDLAFLTGQGIDLLVSLTIESPDSSLLEDSGIASLHLPIPDFHPPTLEQQIDFVERASAQMLSGGRVGVHCTAGMGRSGTMLATYLVYTGSKPREAIATVRKLRPGSIETAAQEASIKAYWEYLQ
jgi:atypical dual specificity phosphatase